MKKILISGANGFIGRHLISRLLSEDADIYAIIYPGEPIRLDMNNDRLHIFKCDAREICKHCCDFPDDMDVFYHFAWVGVNPEARNNFDVQIQNYEITMQCMKFALLKKIKRVVMPGSTNEYLYYGKPINKYAPPSPENAYGAVKVALRYLCEAFFKNSEIYFIYTIITGIYSADRTDNNVIFYTIQKLLNQEKPSLTRLDQLWDYVYIDDVIDALIAVGEQGRKDAVYAIGHGDNWPLRKYIEIIHSQIDSNLPLGIGDIKYTRDILPSSCIDLTDLEQDTCFKPHVDFEMGIARVIEKLKGSNY